jgi:hypothetical protein
MYLSREKGAREITIAIAPKKIDKIQRINIACRFVNLLLIKR